MWLRFPISKVCLICWSPQNVWMELAELNKKKPYRRTCIKRFLSRPASQIIHAICTAYFFLCATYSHCVSTHQTGDFPSLSRSPFETAAHCVCLEHFKTLSVLFPKRFDAARPFEVKSAFKHKRLYVDFSFVLTKFFEKNGKEAALWGEKMIAGPVVGRRSKAACTNTCRVIVYFNSRFSC